MLPLAAISPAQPLIVFVGEKFESVPALQLAKSLLLDMFRGEQVDRINLAGIDRVVMAGGSTTGCRGAGQKGGAGPWLRVTDWLLAAGRVGGVGSWRVGCWLTAGDWAAGSMAGGWLTDWRPAGAGRKREWVSRRRWVTAGG